MMFCPPNVHRMSTICPFENIFIHGKVSIEKIGNEERDDFSSFLREAAFFNASKSGRDLKHTEEAERCHSPAGMVD